MESDHLFRLKPATPLSERSDAGFDRSFTQKSIGKSSHELGFLYYLWVESYQDCPYQEDRPPLNEGQGWVFMSEDYQLKLLDENSERKVAPQKRPIVERRFGGGKK
jgi:hypothetical protein